MSIVNPNVPITSAICNETIESLTRMYPFCRSEILTVTEFGRPLRTLVIGSGPRKVIYTAAHHANEWITAYILLKFCEDMAEAMVQGMPIGDVDARCLAGDVTFYMVPMVDPDGVDLVTGAIPEDSSEYGDALRLSESYPFIRFPEGWKANLLGVDLNLNYPAGWLMAREIKFTQGYLEPGPRDYVGRAPLTQYETKALAGYTEFLDPELVLAFHSQGEEIYWQFEDIFVEGAEELGEKMALVSGYHLTETPFVSAFAGYKDWFIQEFRRPGYTIEVGKGNNPLPIEQFPEIYRACLGILLLGAKPELPVIRQGEGME